MTIANYYKTCYKLYLERNGTKVFTLWREADEHLFNDTLSKCCDSVRKTILGFDTGTIRRTSGRDLELLKEFNKAIEEYLRILQRQVDGLYAECHNKCATCMYREDKKCPLTKRVPTGEKTFIVDIGTEPIHGAFVSPNLERMVF